MDLYGINPLLNKGYADRSHFSRNQGPRSGSSNKFVNNDILSSSAWSSVIHQPSQDSEPEDLPSTVDINAIKEPSTPVIVSAQTPLQRVRSDCIDVEPNNGESGSDSEFESDSNNSDNELENVGSVNSGSCSDSYSESSHQSSCSSRSKQISVPSSCSNSPTGVGDHPFALPKNCNLSENSDDGEEFLSIPRNEMRDTDHLIQKPFHNPDHLEVIDEDDLAAVFSNAKQTGRELDASDLSSNEKNSRTSVETKRILSVFSDSSNDSDMLPKQVVRDAINSIHVEPRSPPCSSPNLRTKWQALEELNNQKGHVPLVKDTKKTWKILPSSGNSIERRVPESLCKPCDIFLVRKKRGPGRPRKRINGISNEKKQKKSKTKNLFTAAVCPANVLPTFQTQDDWLHRQKKRKRKNTKEKVLNPEFTLAIESLSEFFNQKCVIEDKKSLIDFSPQHHSSSIRSKLNQRSKEKNKKRKHSDKESGLELVVALPHASTNETKTKRRCKKNSTEAPKVHQTNCDQRLPLKKRHYHVMAPSTNFNSGHQSPINSKTRVEKHSEITDKECYKNSFEQSFTQPNDFPTLPPTLSAMKKEKPRKRTKDEDIDTPPVLDDYSKQPNSLVGSAFSSKPAPTVLCAGMPSSKKPELITPLPTETFSNMNSLNLKPPAGIFEPTRKLPVSISKCKKTSIDDMLCKLKEKLKGLESPSKNTSALIKKIGENVSDDNYNIPFKRILRSKRTNSEKEKENVNTKKNKILKDVTIRLLKLPIENSSCINEQEQIKPKILKKRKIRNRTGFPMLKKKKKKKIQNTSILNEKINPDCSDIFKTIDVSDIAVDVGSKVEGLCSHTKEIKVKNENREMEPLEISDPENLNIEEKLGILVRDREKLFNRRSQRSQGKEKEDTRKKHGENEEEKGKIDIIKKPPGRLLRKRILSKNLTKQIKLKKSENKSKLKQVSKIGAKRILPTDKSTSSFMARILRKRGKSEADPIKQAMTVENKKKSNKNVNSTMTKLEDVKSKEETDKSEMSDDSKKNDVSKKDIAPKKKRKYIPAGIFSDYYKEDRTTTADLKNRFIQFKPEDHPYGLLPPPPYFDGYLRRRRKDFKLPYDLWWLETYDKLPGRDIVESWKYKRIRLNVYYDVKPPHGYETQACNCKMPEEKDKLGCGDDCINRVLYAECSPELCPLKERCSNQRIQKHNGDMKLVKFMTKDKGIGVKTQKSIKAGEYIVEYVGEVVTDKEFKNRMNSLYKNDIHHYCLNLEGGLLIDGHRMGSDARFVNHSCEPNCEIQKWSVNGRFRMGLFAQRDIKPGEELTYDYNFSLFNPEEGQPCRCRSKMCRGVIGGKSQRVSMMNAGTGNVDTSLSTNVSQGASNCTASKNSRIRPRKQERRKSSTNLNIRISLRGDSDSSNKALPRRNTLQSLAIESLTPDEKKIIQTHRVLLARNLAKVQRVREKIKPISEENSNNQCAVKNNKPTRAIEFSRHLNALSQQRFIKTRGLAQIEDDPEMNKTVQLANLFRTIYTFTVSAKDEESDETFSSFFMSLPSKQKLPMYYQQIEEPIDLTMVEKNILSGVYKDVESFDKDLNTLIANNVKYYGRTSEQGIAAVRLRKAYHIAKLDHLTQIEEITGQPVPSSFRPVQENPGDEEEDVIRCICGLYNDEGMMIQCERCLVWQHIGCVKANSDAEHYHCERCSSKDLDYEIPLDVPPPKVPSPNEKHYLTLMRDELQIRQGDTVYVLRDIRDPETNMRYTYQTVETFKYEDCDILRVEQLWKTKSGEKCAFGHHYLRPCETFHEPTRKFFPNELLKRSVYETVPLDLIMGRCYVLDLRTYCRGRPIDADPEHIYICEYSVNKEMNTFYKMKSKQLCPISTKSYAFETYNPRLRPTRTYTPHVTPAPERYVNMNCVPAKAISETNPNKARAPKPKNVTEPHRNIINPVIKNSLDEDDLPLARIKNANVDGKKLHLNNISLKLLARKPCKCPLDVSYLLEMGKRNRTGKKLTQ